MNLKEIEHFPEFDNLDLIARQVVEGFITGLHKSPFHGFSVEFAEHRLYNKGESTKFIDWKLYARTERLYVKKFEEETNLRAQIIIDTSSSMLFPYKSKLVNKLSFSVYCAAALIYLLRKQRDAVGLSLINNSVDFHSDARLSEVHVQIMYNKLRDLFNPENTGLNKETDTATILHQLADTINKRSLVIIFSDMFGNEDEEKLFSALQHLRYAKHEVLIFHVTDKKFEQNFEFENRPYKFIDMETGRTIKLNPNEVRETYTKLSSDFIKELKNRCGQYSIDFVEADINKDFTEVLQSYLLKRKRLY
jgi:uncharacterized protein (DUF58 family)